MFTTAGDTFFTIGDKEGTGVSPTIAGMAAGAGGAITAVARIAARARSARFMVDSGRTKPGKIPQHHRFYSGSGRATLC
jgi:nitrous oxide reductase